jgi:hypothetical protein
MNKIYCGFHSSIENNFIKIKLLCVFIVAVSSLKVKAQTAEYPNCTYSYFAKSKKVSTSLCYDKEKRWGKALAYDMNSKVIDEKQLRNIAGHASVHFSYHSNGGIAKAEWSSAPDAGIQWYNSIDEFSPDGKLTNHTEMDHEFNRPNVPGIETKEQPLVVMPEPVRRTEQPVTGENFISEFWFVNRTKYKLTIFCQSKLTKGEKYTLSAAPADTVKGGQQILPGHYGNSLNAFDVQVSGANRRVDKKIKIAPISGGVITIRRGLQRQYFEIRMP